MPTGCKRQCASLMIRKNNKYFGPGNILTNNIVLPVYVLITEIKEKLNLSGVI
jgi:hypothetical protein